MRTLHLLPHLHHHCPRVRGGAVFPQINALPGAEGEVAAHDGDGDAGGGQCGLDVRGHVVGAFAGVGVERVVLGDEAAEPGFEVAFRAGVGVLLDDETGRGVADEDGAEAGVDLGGTDDGTDLAGELVEALAAGFDGELLSRHGERVGDSWRGHLG